MTSNASPKGCVFDAYGTLFDVHSPAAAFQSELGEKTPVVSSQWRAKQLEYTWLRSLMGRYADFGQVTADSLDFVLTAHGIDNPSLRDRMLALYRTLSAYDDAAASLQRLKSASVKTGILSNGSPPMLASAVTSAQLGMLLDYIISVDSERIYKPSPRVYQLAADAFGMEPADLAFISANAWDCAGAASFGFQVVHVNRFGQGEERLDFSPRVHVASLTEAVAYVLGTIFA